MAPEFVTPNETVVEENTPVNTVVMAVKAVDRDEGRNSYIEYYLAPVPSKRFHLGQVDGLLRIGAPLDREDRANYSLVVTARDRGTPSNAHTLTISLRVADENDNSPIFDPKQYSASVPENASIGLSVLQVSATDADDSLNGRVRYTIVAGDKNRDFSISEDTGIIRVAKNLNYERRNHYLLTVQAEDSGADVRYDSATVTISIMDINDNAPVFLDSPYLVYVMENMAALPAPIATVTAFDADNPPYNRVNYLVKEGDKSMFSVNATSGQISLLRALDREERDQYTLTVVAMDTGKYRVSAQPCFPPRSSHLFASATQTTSLSPLFSSFLPRPPTYVLLFQNKSYLLLQLHSLIMHSLSPSSLSSSFSFSSLFSFSIPFTNVPRSHVPAKA